MSNANTSSTLTVLIAFAYACILCLFAMMISLVFALAKTQEQVLALYGIVETLVDTLAGGAR